jgi:hypothetical protein
VVNLKLIIMEIDYKNLACIDLSEKQNLGRKFGVAVLGLKNQEGKISFEKMMCGVDDQKRKFMTTDGNDRIFLTGLKYLRNEARDLLSGENIGILVFGVRVGSFGSYGNYPEYISEAQLADYEVGKALKEKADQLNDVGLAEFAREFARMFVEKPWNSWAFN